MQLKRFVLLVGLLFAAFCGRAQQAVVEGYIFDDSAHAMEQALIVDSVTQYSVHSNAKGHYMLSVLPGRPLTIIYYAPGYGTSKRRLSLNPGEIREITVRLKKNEHTLNDFTVKANKTSKSAGDVRIVLEKVDFVPGPMSGVEGLIKLNVGSNNETSSQYSVRGGNFDENLVYVNDFEIYRPFLVRQGQQEGLSFVNSDLVSNLTFSVGGFQPRYGDKMSSVLDVTYKRPDHFSGSVVASLLGANLHLEGASKNKKFTYLFGARQKSNQYLLQSLPTKGVYNPSFTDVQALLSYELSKNWRLEAIGNYARNRFTYFPQTMVSSFGVLNQAYQLDVYYNGGEFDQFDSRFGGLSATYHKDSSKLRLKFLASAFQTHEYETYDIGGEYLFGELQTDMSKKDFGQIKTYLGTGYIQRFARNYLQVGVADMAVRGSYDARKHFIQFGANVTTTNISDALHEWERRDSSRFNQPYDPNGLALAYFYHSSADFNYSRISAYVQDNIKLDSADKMNLLIGVRGNYSLLNNELLISPRANFSYTPRKLRDIIYKLSAGLYQQPPFYREMRDLGGNVNKDLRAQKSLQVVAGLDYNFEIYKRPFRFTAEAYYKNLWDMDPYFYDNVRIRYTGKNDAVGRIYGGEVRLYGDIVKDATSFISVGLMKGQQRITDSAGIAGYDNYFPLPSDQRFMLGMYFEDYLRRNKNFKAHINMMYSSGLPVGPPTGHLYQNTIRLPDYKRVDVGFSALLLDNAKRVYRAHSYFNNLRSIWASLEVFNLLGIQNTLSYSWIQDNSTNARYAVPNRLTSRLLNLKVMFKF